MRDDDQVSEPLATSLHARQYTARSGTRQRSAGATRRLFFFAVAAIWGFIVGVAGLLVGLSAAGQSIQTDFLVVSRLIPASVIALVGGLVIAAAYKESKRRSR